MNKTFAMNNSRDLKKQDELNKLEWSSTSFKVSDFLSKFTLPQVVKVIEGYYGEDEDSSLGADQVLSLHCIKSTDKLVGRDYRGKEVNIPLHCQSKVEVRSSNLKDVYESVDELCSVFPSYVRISQGYYSPLKDEEILNVGDKLCLKSIEKSKKGEEMLVCINQNGQTIELPKDCEAGFQPLENGKECYLTEIITRFSMPVYVQFVDPPIMGKQSRSSDEDFFNSSLGAIYLENSYNENIIIASTISHDGHHTVVTFPREFDIRLAVCEGMLQDTEAYAELCRTLNNGMNLRNLKRIDTFSAFKPRNSVREFPFNELIDPSNYMDVSEIHMSLEPEEPVHLYREVDKPGSPDQEPGLNQQPAELNQSQNYANEEWAQETAVRHQGSLERENGITDTGSPKPPMKPQRSLDSLHRNLKGNLVKSGEQAEPKNHEVPIIKVTDEDTESVKSQPDVSNYSVKQVSEILKELGMDRYIVKFEAEIIDGEMLLCLDNEILMADFGMNKLHCMKLKKYLEGWRPKV